MEQVKKKDGIKGEMKTEDVREETRSEGKEKKKQDKRWGRGVKGQGGDKEIGKRSNEKMECRESKWIERVRKTKRDASEKKEREQIDSEGWRWLMVTFFWSTWRWMFNAVTFAAAPHYGK